MLTETTLHQLSQLPEAARRQLLEDNALAPAQRAMWLLSQLDESNRLLWSTYGRWLDGPLDVTALYRALVAIVDRHSALRTSFPAFEGQPFQLIHDRGTLAFEYVDVSTLEQPTRTRTVERQAAVATQRPLPIDTVPPFRVVLVRERPDRHLLLFTVHHIVVDASSVSLLNAELEAFFAAERRGHRAFLPALGIQYLDYSRWLNRRLSNGRMNDELDWWGEYLAGASSELAIPRDYPVPTHRRFEGVRGRRELSRGLTRELRNLAHTANATMFSALLGAIALLLERYTQQSDLNIGVPVVHRPHRDTENLIGLFLNTVIVRVRTREAANFRALLERVRDSTVQALDHQEVPLETLIQHLHPARSANQNPLFQVLFTMQPETQREIQLADLRVEHWQETRSSAIAELNFAAEDHGETVHLMLEADAELLSLATVEQMLADLVGLLETVAQQPDSPLAGLATRSALAAHAVHARNSDLVSPRVPVHTAFIEQAERNSARTAIAFGSEHITYASLANDAIGFASALRERGLGEGSKIGIALPRTPELIICLVGTLLSGAAYVPLDPKQPPLRLRTCVVDSELDAIIVDDSLPLERDAYRSLSTCELTPSIRSNARGTRPPPTDWEAHPAYVIYTSGSTGRPKGVVVSHGSLSNLLTTCSSLLNASKNSRVLAVTQIGFDIAALELLLPLTLGGTVDLASDATSASPAALVTRIQQARPTWIQATPSMWSAIVEQPELDLSGIVVLCGGEPLPKRLAQTLLGLGAQLINVYGPTEATIWCTSCPVTPEQDAVPIGLPLAGYEAWVVDTAGRLAPPRSIGELLIGGVGLAQSYHEQRATTAASFVPHPWSRKPGGRLYCSGDLVRRRHDGALEFVGRRDKQLKLRGHRVELAEVQAALESVPEVAQAIVVVRRSAPDDHLLAFLRPAVDDLPSVPTLRAVLASHLTSAAIPQQLCWVSEIPITANGKVDEAALLARFESETPIETAGPPPSTSTEQQMAALWRELLHVPHVSVDDDFFSLGGHSLLAARLVGRLRSRMGVEIPLRTILVHPTLGALAGIAERAARSAEAPSPTLTTGRSAPLSAAQRGLWFLFKENPTDNSYNSAVALHLQGPLDREALSRAITLLYQRHEGLRIRFVEASGSVTQEVAPSAQIPFSFIKIPPSADSATQREAQIRRLVLEPFSLTDASPSRIALLECGPEENVLLLVVHHIICDGWSLQVLLRELGELYQGRELPTAPRLLPLLTANAHLRERTENERLQRWKTRLADCTPLDLPLDRIRSGGRGPSGRVSFRLTSSETQPLFAIARSCATTPFVTLLAVWAGTLSRVCGQARVCIGTPVANREQPGTESVVGFLADTVPLNVNLEGDPSFLQLVARVRECVLTALDDQVAFERLVHALSPQRIPHRNPFFDVLLVVQHRERHQSEPKLHGLQCTTLPLGPGGTVKFDLALGLDIDADGELNGGLDFDKHLFDRETVTMLTHQFTRLVRLATTHPDAKISQHSWRSPRETQDLVIRLRARATRPTSNTTVTALFAATVAANGQKQAIVWQDQHLTYEELDRRANTLASQLATACTQPTPRIGVFLERGIDLIVSLLAVLKCGGAYVPLDTKLPSERILQYLADSGASFVITTSDLSRRLHGQVKWCTPCANAARAVKLPCARPEQLAYVLYTSGTTGRPKGVELEHRSVTALVEWARRLYSPTELDGVVAATSIGFDLSVFEIFVPLCTGGTVIMARSGVEPPTGAALDAVRMVNTVPSTAEAMLRDLESRTVLESAHTINLAGEPLETDLVDRLYALGVQRVYDLYGPTEATTYTTACLRRCGAPPSIGHSIDGAYVYLLDSHGRIVPPGVVGEVYIGGTGLARGYQSAPRATAERFVPDPFAIMPGERLYRTGDRARWNRDLSLRYLGRTDRQIKLRGFRIELGEVEQAVLQSPGVSATTVDLWRDRSGEPRLVAWVVPSPNHTSPCAAWRTQLTRKLPTYMVPEYIVEVKKLPLTMNGKLDRQALPAPQLGQSAIPPLRPATAREQILVSLWREVLGVAEVSPHSDFFALGGNSLAVVRLSALLRAHFDVRLKLGDLMALPVLQEQAQLVNLALQSKTPATVELEVRPERRRGPLTASQRRLWLHQQLHPRSSALHQYGAVRISGAIKLQAAVAAIEQVVARHPALRTRFELDVDGPVQHVCLSPQPELSIVDFTDLPVSQQTLEQTLLEFGERLIDIETGPLVRFVLLPLQTGDLVLGIVAHHLIADAWSFTVMFGELHAALSETAFARATTPSLVDVADWERRCMDAERGAHLRTVWRKRLHGAPELLNLPLDRPRVSGRSDVATATEFELDPTLVAQVRMFARSRNATSTMVFLAVWASVLGELCGTTDLVIGVPFATRDHPALQDAVGALINSLPLRIRWTNAAPSLGYLVDQVRGEVLFAMGHADLPFEHIVEAISPRRHTGVHPLFQVWFTHEEDWTRANSDGWRPLWVKRRSVRHDLRMALSERHGEVRAILDGSVALFNASTLRCIAERYQRKLQACLLADSPSASSRAEQKAHP